LVPALWEIKRHYPDASLHVVSTPVGAEVLRLAPCVDRPWPLELDPRKRTLGQQLRLIWSLRRQSFDLAFNFSGADRATILTGMIGARRRVGHRAGREHFWNRRLIQDWVPRQDPELTVFEQRRRILAALGFTLKPPRFDFQVDEPSSRWAAGIVPEDALHLSINSNNPLKEWPVAHYAEMLQAVWRSHPKLRVLASASGKEREQNRLAELRAALKDAWFDPLPLQLSIAQLAAALRRCRMHVGSDSGVMHLAVALGVPTLSFFREQPGYKSWLPTGAGHRILSTPCPCVDHRRAPCESSGRAECLARLEPAQAAAVICERLRA
jgi:ADP-heptose:LPS heptosyltransferase